MRSIARPLLFLLTAASPCAVAQFGTSSVDLGTSNTGTLTCHDSPDAHNKAVSPGGVDCRVNLDSNGVLQPWMRFGVPDTFLFAAANGADVTLTIEYLDNDFGTAHLEIDAAAQNATSHTRRLNNALVGSATGTWKRKTWRVTDAYFGDANEVDFQIALSGMQDGFHVNRVWLVKADTASIDLGSGTTSPELGNGIDCLSVGDGTNSVTTIGGRTCRATSGSSAYFYFQLSDAFALQESRRRVTVTIHYFDNGFDIVNLEYDSIGTTNASKYKSAGSFARGDTQTWKSHTWRLDDAYFGNRQNAGADMRVVLGPGGALDQVCVRDATVNAYAPTDLDPSAWGYWHDASNWTLNSAPQGESKVVIPADTHVVIEAGDAIDIALLEVHGRLDIVGNGDTPSSLAADRIVVMGSGSFEIRHSNLPAATRSTPFLGATRILLTDDSDLVGPLESKRLMVMNPGKLLWEGRALSDPWMRIANKSDLWQGPGTALALETAPSTWAADDALVVSTTDYSHEQSEEVTIQSISGPNVTLAGSGMQYRHYSAQQTSVAASSKSIDMRASVANLTRNIVVEGDTTDQLRWGGDIMIMRPNTDAFAGEVLIKNVELTRMGKYGARGRYPIHFHQLGDTALGGGSLARVESSSIHHCFARAITVHGTNDTQILNNVVYDTYGHAMFLEDGDERRNRFEDNLVMTVRTPVIATDPINVGCQLGQAMVWPGYPIPNATYKVFELHDRNPAGFWISNMENIFERNVVAGSESYGFSWDFRKTDFDAVGAGSEISRHAYSNAPAWMFQRMTAATFSFEGNTAHSCDRVGYFADVDGIGRAVPAVGSSPTAYFTAEFSDCTAFKCRKAGIWYRQYGEAIWNEARLSDNGLAVYLASEGHTEDAQNWPLSVDGDSVNSGLWLDSSAHIFEGMSQSSSSLTGHNPGINVLSHLALTNSLVLGNSANTGHEDPSQIHNMDWVSNGINRSVGHLRLYDASSGYWKARIVRDPQTAQAWTKGVDLYDGMIGIVNTTFGNFTDAGSGSSLRKARVFSTAGIGSAEWFYAIHNRGNPWQIEARNYCSGLTFDSTVGTGNRWGFPSPTQHQNVSPLVPNSMGIHYEMGVLNACLQDLDGSFSGLPSSAARVVINNNNPLMQPQGLQGLVQGPDYTTFPRGSYTNADNKRVARSIGQVQIEYPWDWNRGAVHPWEQKISSRFEYIELTRQTPSGSLTADLYDPFSITRGSTDNYGVERQSEQNRKRVFGINLALGRDVGETPPGLGSTSYVLNYRWNNASSAMLQPNVDQPMDFVARLRFGEADRSVILKIPYSYKHPDSNTSSPLAVDLVRPGNFGSSSTGPQGYVAASDARFRPSTTHLYIPIAGVAPANSVDDVDAMPGCRYYHDGTHLHLKLALGVRAAGQHIFKGQEVIVLVKSRWGD